MDSTTDRWSKRPQSTAGQRNVDKELERVKSLAVVSVLNKSFEKEGVPPPSRSSSLMVAPVLSPSSSLTTDNDTVEIVSNISRSHTVSYNSSEYPSKKTSNASLHNDFKQNIPPSLTTKRSDVHILSSSSGQQQGFVSNDQSALAEKESNTDPLVKSSSIDTEKETLQKRVQELQELYGASLQELQVVKAGNDTQKELVMLQDQLIQNMSSQLEALTTRETTTEELENSGTSIQLDTDEGKQALQIAQQELAQFKTELLDFTSIKTHYEIIIADMTKQLSAYDAKFNEMEKVAKEIQKEHTTQIEYIDTKVQTLVNRLRETNETINKLQVEHIQEKQALIAKYEQAAANNNNTNVNSSSKSINDSSSIIWENEEDGEVDSSRSSFISTASRNNSQNRKSFIARWKGSAIPPASPPPSLPLPPIPSTSASKSSNRPRSTLSEIYASTSTISNQHKHISMDAVGGVDRRRPSNQSELEVQMTDAAYYKEFTDQLQERLSISKEIDDLRVWEPSDYDAIQKKIESKDWSSGDDSSSHHNRDSAFWKGMKKKLRV